MYGKREDGEYFHKKAYWSNGGGEPVNKQGQQQEKDNQPDQKLHDTGAEGRNTYDMDIDRMVNEGLGGGTVTLHNGLIAESTTDTMEPDSEGE